jgi:hypothetical protein
LGRCGRSDADDEQRDTEQRGRRYRPHGHESLRAGGVAVCRRFYLPAFGNPPEFVAKICGGLPAAFRILGQTFLDDAIQPRGCQRLIRRYRNRLVVQNRRNHARLARTCERLPARDHLAQDGPEGKDVRAAVGLFPLELFGRHVLNGAENGSRACHGLLGW